MEGFFRYQKATGHDHGARFPVHAEYDEEATNVEILELCFHEDIAVYEDQLHKVSVDDLDEWLQKEHSCALPDPDQAHCPTLQIAIIRVSYETRPFQSKIPEASMDKLIESFRLRTVYNYCGTTGFVCTARNRSGDSTLPFTYCISVPRDTTILATCDSLSGKVRALCWTSLDQIQPLCQILKAFNGPVAHHPLYVGCAMMVLIGRKIDRGLRDEEKIIIGIEQKTGHHNWFDSGPEAQGDFRKLSADITGVKTMLARVQRHMDFATRANDFMLGLTREVNYGGELKGREPLTENSKIATVYACELLGSRLEASVWFMSELKTRAEAQISAIFHLITQEDTQLSISLARDSTSLAQDSKVLAEAAKRDANSMKTLALVTMVFLPPTTVATIFAMPFFYWDNNSREPRTSSRFWIYWVVAIPLTIITIGVWWIWIRQADDLKKKLRDFDSRFTERSTNGNGRDTNRRKAQKTKRKIQDEERSTGARKRDDDSLDSDRDMLPVSRRRQVPLFTGLHTVERGITQPAQASTRSLPSIDQNVAVAEAEIDDKALLQAQDVPFIPISPRRQGSTIDS